MNEVTLQESERRVLVLAPTPTDARFCRTILTEAELPVTICVDLPEMCRQIAQGAAVALIAEEALNPAVISMLIDALAGQPAWSDLPILVLVQSGVTSEVALSVLETLGNVTLLERPVRVPTLVSAVRTALRARLRQYQIRELLVKADQTADTLREEAKRKDEFLAMLAHELRNPLAPIRNGIGLLKLDSTTGQDSSEILTMMERQVGQMVRLVDDLLDVSRILRGKISLQQDVLDLSTVIKQALETARPLIDMQRHELTLLLGAGPLQVRGDAVRLAQVFANLLNNAAKYTDPGGHILVKVERLASNRLLTSIRDDGVGISADMLTRVFDLFSQAERSLDRSQGGLGLGLTLVRRLVEMHGGKVEASSQGLGHGSEFRVELPAVREATGGRRLLRKEVPFQISTANRRILVVDDNRDAADSLARLLRAAGHEVQIRYDGAAALEELPRFEPDVVLLDVGLPGMSGYDVARCIRNSRRPLLLIAVTGYGQDEDRRCSAAAGFDHHFVKPVDLEALQKTLNGFKSPPHPSP